jgi:hypothetical protein
MEENFHLHLVGVEQNTEMIQPVWPSQSLVKTTTHSTTMEKLVVN